MTEPFQIELRCLCLDEGDKRIYAKDLLPDGTITECGG